MSTDQQGRWRPGWLLALFAQTAIVHAVVSVLRPTAIYQAIELGVPGQWLGAVGASFALVPLLLALPTGRIVDRYSERAVLLAGATLTVAAGAGFVWVSATVWGLLASTVVLGLGQLCAMLGQQALLANRAPAPRYDTVFGHYTFWASVGQAAGPGLLLVFGGSAPTPDIGRIFVVATLAAVTLVPLTLPLPGRIEPVPASGPPRPGSAWSLLRRQGMWRALATSAVVLAAVDITLAYLPALGTERGISAGMVGLLLGLRATASMISRLFLGRLVAFAGRGRVLGLSLVTATLGMALLPVPMPLWLLGVVMLVAGLGLGAGQPITMSWLAEATPPGLRGRAMSLRLTGNRLGQVIVPATAGLVAAGAGAAGVLWVTSAALGAVGVLSRGALSKADPGR